MSPFITENIVGILFDDFVTLVNGWVFSLLTCPTDAQRVCAIILIFSYISDFNNFKIESSFLICFKIIFELSPNDPNILQLLYIALPDYIGKKELLMQKLNKI